MLCSPNLRQLPVATFKTIDINSVSTSDVRTIGGEYLVLSQLKEYKFDNILKEYGFNKDQIDYAKMLVIGRLLYPLKNRKKSEIDKK
ncbi:hypothetical protein GMMP15_2080013 [Candidatus Magnetomoraceae bacterium gMMP-15]